MAIIQGKTKIEDPFGVDVSPAKEGGNLAYLAPCTTVGDGTQTVANAGTRVQVSATSVPCRRVFVQAHESNTDTIVVGGATVVAALIGRRGKAISPTQSEWFNVANLNLLYIDSVTNGDKINFYYEN